MFLLGVGFGKSLLRNKKWNIAKATGYNRTQSKYYNYVYIQFTIYDDFNSPN